MKWIIEKTLRENAVYTFSFTHKFTELIKQLYLDAIFKSYCIYDIFGSHLWLELFEMLCIFEGQNITKTEI